MLSFRAFRLVGLVLLIFGYVGVIPYTWDFKALRLKSDPKCRRRCTIVTTLYIMFVLYLLEGSVRYWYNGNLEDFNVCYLFLIGNLLVFINLSIPQWPTQKGMTMFNTALSYSSHIGMLLYII